MDSEGYLDYSHVSGDTISWKPKQNLVKAPSATKKGSDDDEEEEERSFFSLFSPSKDITKPVKDADNDDEREMNLDQAFEFGLTVKSAVSCL